MGWGWMDTLTEGASDLYDSAAEKVDETWNGAKDDAVENVKSKTKAKAKKTVNTTKKKATDWFSDDEDEDETPPNYETQRLSGKLSPQTMTQSVSDSNGESVTHDTNGSKAMLPKIDFMGTQIDSVYIIAAVIVIVLLLMIKGK